MTADKNEGAQNGYVPSQEAIEAVHAARYWSADVEGVRALLATYPDISESIKRDLSAAVPVEVAREVGRLLGEVWALVDMSEPTEADAITRLPDTWEDEADLHTKDGAHGFALGLREAAAQLTAALRAAATARPTVDERPAVSDLVRANVKEALENLPDLHDFVQPPDEAAWIETRKPIRLDSLVDGIASWVLNGYGATTGLLAALPYLAPSASDARPSNDRETFYTTDSMWLDTEALEVIAAASEVRPSAKPSEEKTAAVLAHPSDDRDTVGVPAQADGPIGQESHHTTEGEHDDPKSPV